MPDFIHIHPSDNVAVALHPIAVGTVFNGITANTERCYEMMKNSIGIVTALAPYIGYEHSSSIARKALDSGGSVYDLVLESDLVTREQLDAILSPERMLCPGEDKALIKEIAERLEKMGR